MGEAVAMSAGELCDYNMYIKSASYNTRALRERLLLAGSIHYNTNGYTLYNICIRLYTVYMVYSYYIFSRRGTRIRCCE